MCRTNYRNYAPAVTKKWQHIEANAHDIEIYDDKYWWLQHGDSARLAKHYSKLRLSCYKGLITAVLWDLVYEILCWTVSVGSFLEPAVILSSLSSSFFWRAFFIFFFSKCFETFSVALTTTIAPRKRPMGMKAAMLVYKLQSSTLRPTNWNLFNFYFYKWKQP